jgi:hypothetical protein
MRTATSYRTIVITLLSFGVIFTGCHLFEHPENIDDCPLNSGYPCPCNPSVAPVCMDDSPCLFYNNPEMGFCSRPCAGIHDDATCQETAGYGVQGLCRFTTLEDSTEPTNCQVACEYDNLVGECPPGLECIPFADELTTYKVCYPIEIATADTRSDCGSFCAKFINCAAESGEDPPLTVAECEQGCVDEDWMGRPCERCWFTCDVNAICSEFFNCYEACGCEK